MPVALVDDDPGVREALAFLLEIAGHAVDSYASANDFLRRCDLDRLAALIVDQHMPEMTGLELTRHLRTNRQTFPILLITAASSSDIVAHAAKLGIEKVLVKPFADAEIMDFVERLAD